MENQNNQNKKDVKNERFVCNEPAGWSLEEMESKISMLTNHNDIPASEDFRQKLKTRVLEAHAKNNMSRFSGLKNLWNFVKVPRFSAVIAVLLLIAVAGGVLLNGYLGQKGSRFARILINPAYAADDFSLVALAGDSTGVTPDSVYKLTSKESFATSDIKAGLTLSPAVEADVKQVSDKEWMITPTEELPPNSLLRITLAAAINDNGQITNRDFAWAFQIKDNFRVLSSIPGDASTNVPLNTGIEVTFSHPNLDSFEKSFSISPEVKGRFEYHARTAVFVPAEPLKASELYTVTVGAGLGLTGSDEKLGSDYKVTFETMTPSVYDSSQKWFSVSSSMLQFTPEAYPYVGVYGDDSIVPTVEIYSFGGFNEFRAALDARDEYPRWSEKWNNYKYDTSKLDRVSNFTAKIETQNYSKFISFPSRLPIGFYLANVSANGKTTSVLIQVSDMNILYNVDPYQALVWVNRPSDGTPLVGAEVRVGDLVNARTDSSGAVVWAVPGEFHYKIGEWNREGKPIYMTVVSGASASITEMSFGAEPVPNRWSYFYTDRPRYQADDTVRFWAMARDRGEATDVKYSVVLRKSGWYDYYYNPVKISEVEVTPDAYGTVTGEISLKGLRPDYYQVALVADGIDVVSRYINVEPYIKPAYAISVTSDVSAAFAGEQIKFTATATLFDGTPASGIELKVQGQSGDSFGKYTTDEKGQITFTDSVSYNDRTTNWPIHSWYTVSPVSAELGEISATATATWYGSRYYTTAETKYPEKGKTTIEFKVRKLDMGRINSAGANASWTEDWRGSEPVSGATVTGDFIKHYTKKVETGTAYDFINKTTYKTYRYDRLTDIVDRVSLTTGADGVIRYSAALDKGAYYTLEYTVKDMAGRPEKGNVYAYYYDGNYYYYDYSSNPDVPVIELNKDDQLYSLGERVKATLMIGENKAASGGANRFLFAKYQNGLKEWQVQNGSEYQFVFSESDAPNVQLFAAWWDGKNYKTARTDGWWGRSYGGARYKYADRELTISAEFNKPAYAPGDEAKVKVTVKDKNGRPVKASVNLNLVDEAYYAIANDSSNPLASIYTLLYSDIIQTKQTQNLAPEATAMGAERGGCFVAGTMIRMADGTTKAIEKVTVGDRVATLANPLNKDVVTGTVSEVFEHDANKLISINNGLLKATPEHMIYASGTFKTAGEIVVGDILVGLDGKKIPVTSIDIVFEKAKVYNLSVDPYHTFIANGIYVHNDKDGAVRQKFVDVALFRTVETDASGKATVDFTLPDNVTTWRLTSQAIGKDLTAGINVMKLKVTLPAFVDVVVGGEYLAGDQVTAKVRSFGTALSAGQTVSYSVTAPDLADFSVKTEGKAFTPVEVKLPELPLGSHDVTYSMKSAAGNDAVMLPLNVVKSYLQANKILSETDVAPGTQFSAPGASDEVRVTFVDASTARFYRMLSSLSWSWGKRVDQTLAHSLAADLLLKNYYETGHDNAFDGNAYQQADGGIGLLPYSSSDMDLSARLAALAPEKFDTGALRQYFFRELDSKKATPETATDALLGLASLGDPVLARLQLWKERTDLSLESRMRTSLALYKLGAYEDARAIYNEVVRSAEERGAYYLLSGDNDNATLTRTAFLAELASALNMPERDRLWAYVTDHKYDKGIELLVNLEEIAFASYALPTLAPGPSIVNYELNGVKNELNLNGWGNKTITLDVSRLADLKITEVKGSAKAIVSAPVAVDKSEIAPSADVSIKRNYKVGDSQTTSFKDGDIVRVSLDVSISRNSPAKYYQVTDILPAGLIPTVNVPYNYYRSWIHPFSVDEHKVLFMVSSDYMPSDAQGNHNIHLEYFARVKTKGVYKAEPAIIQAFKDPATINLTPAQTITVQ